VSREEQKIRVLIADDDALLRDIAIATFEGAGFEVEAVTTGNAAIAACAARMPDMRCPSTRPMTPGPRTSSSSRSTGR
jgi:CheY-like chemotaxis protein